MSLWKITIIVILLAIGIYLLYKYFSNLTPTSNENIGRIDIETVSSSPNNVSNLNNHTLKSILKNPLSKTRNLQSNFSKRVTFNPKKFFNDGTVRSL